MYCLDIQAEEKEPYRNPINADRLLRSLGISGTLVGFKYIVFIVEDLIKGPNERYYFTKSIYPDTAKYFKVGAASVERAIRTVIDSCWERSDHRTLDYIAGNHLDRKPTNSEFIDLLAAFLRYKK